MTLDQETEILLNSKPGKKLLPAAGDIVDINAPPQRGLNLGPLVRTLKRRVLIVVSMAALTTVAAARSVSKAPPIYEGSFQILAEPVTSEGRLTDPSSITRDERLPMAPNSADALDYATVLEILTSAKIQSEIVEQIQAKHPNLKSFKLKSPLLVERITKKTKSKDDVGDTKIIKVTYQDSHPDIAQIVLDTTAQVYLKYSLDERKTRIGQAVEFIQQQLPTLQQRVDSYRKQLQQLQENFNLIDPQTRGEALFTQVRQLTTDQLASDRELQEQKTLYNKLQEQLKLNPNEALDASTLSENPTYQNILKDIKEIDSKIARESARFLPENPQIQTLQEQQQNLQNLLDREKGQILGDNSGSTNSNSKVKTFQNSTRQELIKKLVDTANQIQILEVRNQSIARNKNAFQRQAEQLPAVLRQYNEIQRQLEVTTKTFEQLLSQRENLRVEAAQKTIPWELIAKPEIRHDAAGKPIPLPNSPKKLIVGFAAGLILGIGISVLYEKYRDIFYGFEDIKDTTELPILGKIPLRKSSRGLIPFIALIGKPKNSNNSRDEVVLDAFESLYANIRFGFCDPPIRSLVVTSAAPGDGKSTVALQLAQTAAAMGKTVLLVDADLRSPQIHTQLNLPNIKGLCDMLETTLDPKDAIAQISPTENLFILTAGEPHPDSPKRLASAHMQHLMDQFHARFDLVIYDTTNLLKHTDACFLAANTDGILMVVTVKQTKQSFVQKALERSDKYSLSILGVVANRVKTSCI